MKPYRSRNGSVFDAGQAPGLTTGQRRRSLAGMDRFILAVVYGAGLAAFGWALFTGMGVLAALLFAIAIDIERARCCCWRCGYSPAACTH